jgi:CheY-like chemotaxis protein
MSELIKSLALIMDPIPKTVPLVISIDGDVPPIIVSDDLKLFRSALNLLSNAVERTVLGVIWLRIFRKEGKDGSPHVLFECTDTGPDVPVEQYQYLYKPSQSLDGDVRVGLSSVASLIHSIDGECGFAPLGMHADGRREAQRKQGSIFWFSIPLHEPENAGVDNSTDASVSILTKRKRRPRGLPGVSKAPIIPDFPRTGSGSLLSRVGSTSLLRGNTSGSFCTRTGSGNSVSSQGFMHFRIRPDDNFHGSSLQNTPFPDVPASPIVGSVTASTLPARAEEDRKPAAKPTSLAHPPGQSRAEQLEDSKPPGRKRRALVIEDSATVRKLLARALDKLGYEVTQAPDGLQGLKRLKEKLFDLTLCDFLMPVMDGMDCVKQYRDWEKEHRPWFSSWIVGISAHANVNDKGQGITAGMNEFRPKPVSIKDLEGIQSSEPVVERSRQLDMLEASISGRDRRSSFATMPVQMFPTTEGVAAPPAAGDPAVENVAKRMKFTTGDTDHSKRNPVCLMATDKPSRRTSEVLLRMEQNGWKVGVVNDGNEALRLLKMRNWDAVLIDDDLPVMSGVECMDAFREWEEENRVNRQRRTFLLCGENVPSPTDTSAIVQAPTGFDYVLNRPLIWADLDYLFTLAEGRMEILTRN